MRMDAFWDIRCKIIRWQVQGNGRARVLREDGAMDSENANKSKKKKTSYFVKTFSFSSNSLILLSLDSNSFF